MAVCCPGLNNAAPAFAVADHRGQDPASSVLSFEGRCYLLIQIQIQNVVPAWLLGLCGNCTLDDGLT